MSKMSKKVTIKGRASFDFTCTLEIIGDDKIDVVYNMMDHEIVEDLQYSSGFIKTNEKITVISIEE